MNPAKREFRDYLADILDNARKLKSFISGMSFEEFQADEKTQYASCGPWKLLAKLRNVFRPNFASAILRFPGAI